MIPNRIHFVFGLDPAFGGKPFSFIHFLAIASASAVNGPSEIIFHHAYEGSGEWWERARPLVRLNRVSAPEAVHGRTVSHYAHKADVLRLEILRNEGGIYLDADTFCVRPFRPLLEHSTVMGIEPNAGLCNAVILAEPGAPFITEWLARYGDFSGDDWRSHSVSLPCQLSREQPDLIHVEDEHSFFFPTYDDPMHVLLWQDRISLGQRFKGFIRLAADTGYYVSGDWPVRVAGYFAGTLSSRRQYHARLRRSFCLHFWESLWWEPYLRDLTPGSLRRSGGLFAALVTEILGEICGDIDTTSHDA